MVFQNKIKKKYNLKKKKKLKIKKYITYIVRKEKLKNNKNQLNKNVK